MVTGVVGYTVRVMTPLPSSIFKVSDKDAGLYAYKLAEPVSLTMATFREENAEKLNRYTENLVKGSLY